MAAAAALLLPLASADAAVPLPPVNLTASPTDGGIQLAWSPPPVSPAAIVGYIVYRSDGAGDPMAQIDTVDAAQTTYLDATTDGDHVYTYYVTSQSARAESVPSNPSFAGPYPRCFDPKDMDCFYPLPPDQTVGDLGILHP